MKKIKIYYQQFEGDGYIPDMKNSPLPLDGVGIEPKRQIQEIPNTKTYYECPAFQHKASREFIVYAARDIRLEIDRVNRFVNSSLREDQFHKYVQGQNRSNLETYQLPIPMFLFWTKEKNVWLDQSPHPNNALCNFVTIGGWWNLSSWTRPLSFAIDILDDTKPIVIKRGDPLYKVRFFKEGDLNCQFTLVKARPDDLLVEDTQRRIALKDVIPKLSKNLMFKKQESKCPFAFLYKK
jgi:hypothetical protein